MTTGAVEPRAEGYAAGQVELPLEERPGQLLVQSGQLAVREPDA